MKKKITRIMACFMACLILANTVAIPRAKASAAVVGTSALATSALASYMTATGVPLTVISGGAAAASAGTASLVSGYAAATGATYEVVTTAIAAGATISGGTIILTAAAVAVLAGITAWVISKYNVQKDGQPVPIVPSLTDKAYYNGVLYPSFSDYMSETHPYIMIAVNSSSRDRVYFTSEPLKAFTTSGKIYVGHQSVSDVTPYYRIVYDKDNRAFTGTVYDETSRFTKAEADYIWSNYDVTFDDGTLFASATEPVPVEDWNNPTISTKLAEDYTPLEELPDTSQLVIHTGATPQTAPEALPDAIYTQMATGTFAPTYEEQAVSNPEPEPNPNPDPDVGGEVNPDSTENTGLLRRIAIACEALADKIINGIKSIFAPDAELMQEIADTFTSKFGFVTTLHDLGSDLLSISADSEPPVVYIHLEDAEGNIDYGGTVKALDMTWYSRYKADADRVLSGFLWLGFVWMLFKRIPSIIKGTSMETEERSKL